MSPDEPDLTIRPYEPSDEAAVIDLWRRCGLVVPWNDPQHDIALKQLVNPELFLVATAGGRPVGTVMAGYDGHRGAINYVGVDPELRRHGYGRQLMAAAEELLRQRDCPKINLHVRTSNTGVIAFYERLGYKLDPTVCLGKRLD